MNGYSITHITADTLQRMDDTRRAHPVRHTPQRPVLQAAGEALSRRGLAALCAEHLNSALQRVVELAYEPDTDGRMANVDAHDGRLLVAAPWGSAGYRKYGLRRREADVLRAILFARMSPSAGGYVPLFLWDADRRVWCVNLADYPSAAQAGGYVAHAAVTVREYKRGLQAVQKPATGRT